jgi:perosamine synthetase
MDPKRRYYFPVTGYNFRLTNVACAMLCAQLARREEILSRRLEIFSMYDKLLKDLPGIGFQSVAPWATRSPWLYCITVDAGEFGCSREQLMAGLADQGIETRPFFIPLHTLPPFREGSRRRGEQLPATTRLAARGLNLPTFSTMPDSAVKTVCDAIARKCKGRSQ